MFCSECGKQIPDNTKFCNHCGAQQSVLSGTEPQPAPQPQQAAQPQPTPEKRKNIKWIIGWVLIACQIIVVVSGLSDGSLQEKLAEEGIMFAIGYFLLGAIGLCLVISELLRARK